MEVSIAICDDLPEERAALTRLLENDFQRRPETLRLRLFSGAEELLDILRPGLFHILFLDIFMPGLSGVEAARRIRKVDRKCAIIFATTSQEHGLESFEVRASDYLVKPFRQEPVSEALDWCMGQLADSMRAISVLSEWEQVEVPLQDLRYIEIQGHQARLYTRDQVLTTRRGLDDLERAISSPDFLRCHRSYLVNMNYIADLEGRDFFMEGGGVVPIASGSAPQVRRVFMDWLFARDWEKQL